jgi:hypothetical protein
MLTNLKSKMEKDLKIYFEYGNWTSNIAYNNSEGLLSFRTKY